MSEEAQRPQTEESLELLLNVPLRVTIELGQTRMRVQELLELSSGQVIELQRLAGEPVDVLVNGRSVAFGEIVVVNDRYAVRVVSIRNPNEPEGEGP